MNFVKITSCVYQKFKNDFPSHLILGNKIISKIHFHFLLHKFMNLHPDMKFLFLSDKSEDTTC